MEVVLYSTGCPRCKDLKRMLGAKNIEHTENNSVEDMLALVMKQAPMLKVGEEIMDFRAATQWVKQQ